MIHGQLKLKMLYGAHVVVLPNMTVCAGLDPDAPVEPQTYRPVEVLRPGDFIEDCEFIDRGTGDRFNLAAGTTWRISEIEVEPLANDLRHRIITLVRVGP